jgi:hypothetical protein
MLDHEDSDNIIPIFRRVSTIGGGHGPTGAARRIPWKSGTIRETLTGPLIAAAARSPKATEQGSSLNFEIVVEI